MQTSTAALYIRAGCGVGNLVRSLIAPFVALQAVDAWLGTAHTEGLEQHKDFLCRALKNIAAIEETTLR